jgi:hypothetical protein
MKNRSVAATVNPASLAGMVVAGLLWSFTGCANQNVAFNVKGKPVSGYVRMTQVQAAYIGSGNAGHGTLDYHGDAYPFKVGGLMEKSMAWSTSAILPAPMLRLVMASPWVAPARESYRCRTKRESSCT